MRMGEKKEYTCSRCGAKFESSEEYKAEEVILCPKCQKELQAEKKKTMLLNIRNLIADEITRLSNFSPGGAYLMYFDEITYLSDKDKRLQANMAVEFEIIVTRLFEVQKDAIKKKKYKDYDWLAMWASLYEKYYIRYTDIGWAKEHAQEFAEYIQETTNKELQKAVSKKSDSESSDSESASKERSVKTDNTSTSKKSITITGVDLSEIVNLDELYCFSKKRIRSITKNEIQFLANAMRHEQLKESGQKTHTWVTFHDERVRPTHRIADFQTKPIDEPFNVGGYKMMFPGDSSFGAPPQEIINCRCIEK